MMQPTEQFSLNLPCGPYRVLVLDNVKIADKAAPVSINRKVRCIYLSREYDIEVQLSSLSDAISTAVAHDLEDSGSLDMISVARWFADVYGQLLNTLSSMTPDLPLPEVWGASTTAYTH